MQSLSNRRTWALALTLAAAVSYYAIILTNGSFAFVTRASPSEEWSLGLVFNSMLFQLLSGEFDVDPRSVGAVVTGTTVRRSQPDDASDATLA